MTPDQTPDDPPEAPTGIAAQLEAVHTTLTELERFMAGYNTLSRAYHTLTNKLPAGQRPKGLLLTFKGSTDDVHAIDVVIDVQKHVDPAYAPNVLVPLANGQATGMLVAVERLLAEATEMRVQIRVLLGLPAEAQPPAA